MYSGKRGATHADWAISLGIFLIYILGLLIIVQPGMEPIYRNENLIKIVEDSMDRDLTTTLKVTPIYIDGNSLSVPAGTKVYSDGTGKYYQLQLNIKDEFGLTKADQLYAIKDLKTGFKPSKIIANVEGEDKINFDAEIYLNRLNKYLFYSSEEPYAKNNPALFPTLKNGKNFDYELGAEETLKGFSNSQLKNLQQYCTEKESYENLKDAWNYPPNKEFQIFVYSGIDYKEDKTNLLYSCSVSEPYDQANVFVDEFTSYILNNDGTLEPIRVNVRVW